jgi:hypothetical protein
MEEIWGIESQSHLSENWDGKPNLTFNILASARQTFNPRYEQTTSSTLIFSKTSMWTHLCPLIHHPTKYQPKIISCYYRVEGKRTVGGGHGSKNIKHPPTYIGGDAYVVKLENA